METENEQVQEEVVEQEENTTTQEETVDESEETQDEDTVTLSKSEYKKLQRQSIAYKANKDVRAESKPTAESTILNVSPERLEKLELKLDGYSQEEVEAIMELGGAKALKNPLVAGAIEQMRNKSKSKDLNQSLNSKSPVFKKFTQDDLSKMTSAELVKILPHD